jgi:hypothetical protein
MQELRDYRPGDEEDVFRIVKQVLAEYGLTTNPEQTDADLKNIRQSYLMPGDEDNSLTSRLHRRYLGTLC